MFSRDAENGSSLVEAAIIFPVIILLLMGFIQYAMLFSAEISLRNAASIGARTALNTESLNTTVTDAISNALRAGGFTNIPVITDLSDSTEIKFEVAYSVPLFFSSVVPNSLGGEKEIRVTTVVPK